MIVVADTSPINYLVLLGYESALKDLYGSILIPDEVLKELRRDKAPRVVREWAMELPDWVSVRAIQPDLRAETKGLDAGERAAISLALEMNASLLMVDERKARHVAISSFQLKTIGTLGIIRDAHRIGFLDGHEALEALSNRTNFRLTPAIRKTFLELLQSR